MLAHEDLPERSLDALLGVVAEQLDIDSVVIVVAGRSEGLEIVASVGLGEAAAQGLAAAIRNPGHPIARTAADATSRKRMIPLPCSQRELNTGHGIDGRENRQCPNGQFFPVSVRNAETNQLQVAVRGGGGNRTPVLRSRLGSISGRSRRFGSRICRAHRRARHLPAR